MLALARRAGIDARSVAGRSLPFADGEFDAAVATQVYEFVDDLPTALVELERVLRPGGRAVILDTDWDSVEWHSSDRERMRRVLHGWRQRTADPYLPRTLASRLRDAGLETLRRETFTIFDVRGHDGSYSALQIEHLGASAAGVPAHEVAGWAADLRALARAGDYFFTLNRYVFLAQKPNRHSYRRRG